MMPLTPKKSRVETLSTEALQESTPKRNIGQFLATKVWPYVQADVLGREVTKEEVEEYLGFGPGGV